MQGEEKTGMTLSQLNCDNGYELRGLNYNALWYMGMNSNWAVSIFST